MPLQKDVRFPMSREDLEQAPYFYRYHPLRQLIQTQPALFPDVL